MPPEAGARLTLLHYFRAHWAHVRKNIAGAVPHATILTFRFEGPRYYGSDRLISPSPHHPIPHCNITARIASITTHIIPFRTVILRFETAIPPHLMTLFRISILRLGPVHLAPPDPPISHPLTPPVPCSDITVRNSHLLSAPLPRCASA